jgi:hypothetical protein
MFKFLRSLSQPKLVRDFDKREPESYSWHEGQHGHTYVSNKNRKILYRITKTDKDVYQVESLNNVPKVVGTYLDLDAAKKGAERRWVDLNTWIS